MLVRRHGFMGCQRIGSPTQQDPICLALLRSISENEQVNALARLNELLANISNQLE
jgi:hypothetical protein